MGFNSGFKGLNKGQTSGSYISVDKRSGLLGCDAVPMGEVPDILKHCSVYYLTPNMKIPCSFDMLETINPGKWHHIPADLNPHITSSLHKRGFLVDVRTDALVVTMDPSLTCNCSPKTDNICRYFISIQSTSDESELSQVTDSCQSDG